MIRRKHSGKLHRSMHVEEDVNPMEGTSNLADAMLVLAVGIMLALIMNWDVDLSKVVGVDELDKTSMSEEDMTEVEQEKALMEKGTVYMDPETGKYYIEIEE